jgi:hypothetical protein
VASRWSTISFVPLEAGIVGGRFSGFENNPNTRSREKGTPMLEFKMFSHTRPDSDFTNPYCSVFAPELQSRSDDSANFHRKSAPMAEVKKNISERIAKEPWA